VQLAMAGRGPQVAPAAPPAVHPVGPRTPFLWPSMQFVPFPLKRACGGGVEEGGAGAREREPAVPPPPTPTPTPFPPFKCFGDSGFWSSSGPHAIPVPPSPPHPTQSPFPLPTVRLGEAD
jgi:hypothetical protein